MRSRWRRRACPGQIFQKDLWKIAERSEALQDKGGGVSVPVYDGPLAKVFLAVWQPRVSHGGVR